MNKIFLTLLLIPSMVVVNAQQKTDTVVVALAKTSKIIFTINDMEDLEILKHYDFDRLFKDILNKLEHKDTVIVKKDSVNKEENISNHSPEPDRNDDAQDNEYHRGDNNKYRNQWRFHRENTHWGKTWQSFNFDLGINNYVDKGNQKNANYVIRPLGSWYVAINSIQRLRLAKKIFLELGTGLSCYNFKFQNDKTHLNKSYNQLFFENDIRNNEFIKSKLTVTYLNISLVPVFDLGDNDSKNRIWEGGSSFRIGLGPYAGYRIGSHTKQEYKDNGNREKEKNHDNFYLADLRYGARLQLGFRSTDLFFNYDFNKLFASGKGPDLNAFSFGVVF